MTHGVAIAGCGLIGQKRARAIPGARLVACSDLERERAEALARRAPRAVATADWQSAIDRPDVDIAVVATRNDVLAAVSRFAVEAGKHALVEKLAARSVAEIDGLIDAAGRCGRLARVGFNHRYHPALLKARALFDSGAQAPAFPTPARHWPSSRTRTASQDS